MFSSILHPSSFSAVVFGFLFTKRIAPLPDGQLRWIRLPELMIASSSDTERHCQKSQRFVFLDNGGIDVCEECGEQIAFRRLLARPVTTLCIDCKEQSEREEAAIAQAGRGGFSDEDHGEDMGSGGDTERAFPTAGSPGMED